MSTAALPGFRDFFPAEFAERAHIFEAWRDVARRFGFVEYDGPPLEPLELYTKKSGDEIVAQLYNFEDKGGRQVALRPEMTPTVARMVAARANALRKPVRWFSIPQLFRYERQQRGRLREHFQLNVDIFGEADVAADAELVAVAIEVMRALGLTHEDVRVRVSDRRILHSYLTQLGVPHASLAGVFGVVDKLERQPASVSAEKLGALGVPADAHAPIIDLPNATLDSVADTLARSSGEQPVADFRRFAETVNALVGDGDRWLRFDMSIVRGLAYYTGIVFELFDAQGEFRAICGGGRYDNLLDALGGVSLPALGFGMGDVVLAELLRARGKMPAPGERLDFWVAPVMPDLQLDAARVVSALRAAGASVEYPLREQALAKQLKAATSARASRVVIVGPALAERREVEVKTLADGRQAPILVDELVEQVRSHYRGASDRPW